MALTIVLSPEDIEQKSIELSHILMKVTAVIPIRKGSQRVRDKNLRPFAGTNLMELKIKTLLRVPEIDEIIVNTNSDDAIAIVNKSYRGG